MSVVMCRCVVLTVFCCPVGRYVWDRGHEGEATMVRTGRCSMARRVHAVVIPHVSVMLCARPGAPGLRRRGQQQSAARVVMSLLLSRMCCEGVCRMRHARRLRACQRT